MGDDWKIEGPNFNEYIELQWTKINYAFKTVQKGAFFKYIYCYSNVDFFSVCVCITITYDAICFFII